jgi:hypothetical protein
MSLICPNLFIHGFQTTSFTLNTVSECLDFPHFLEISGLNLHVAAYLHETFCDLTQCLNTAKTLPWGWLIHSWSRYSSTLQNLEGCYCVRNSPPLIFNLIQKNLFHILILCFKEIHFMPKVFSLMFCDWKFVGIVYLSKACYMPCPFPSMFWVTQFTPQSSTKAKNEYSYNSTSSYTFMTFTGATLLHNSYPLKLKRIWIHSLPTQLTRQFEVYCIPVPVHSSNRLLQLCV